MWPRSQAPFQLFVAYTRATENSVDLGTRLVYTYESSKQCYILPWEQKPVELLQWSQ